MANHKASEGTVKIGSNPVAEIRDYSMEQTANTIETTQIGYANKTFVSGQVSSSGSMTCFWDETDTNGQVAMAVGNEVELNIYPEGSDSGASYYGLTALITSVGVSASVDGLVERSFGFQGTGAVVLGTV